MSFYFQIFGNSDLLLMTIDHESTVNCQFYADKLVLAYPSFRNVSYVLTNSFDCLGNGMLIVICLCIYLLRSLNDLLNMLIFFLNTYPAVVFSHLSLQPFLSCTRSQQCFTTAVIQSYDHFEHFQLPLSLYYDVSFTSPRKP